ncbi:MAG: winged helix-turn-helix transcriptional regulator [Labilithrix sp.]|nr:winged helix-turn-helix transcriptional regulator [Labilithrix sp.]
MRARSGTVAGRSLIRSSLIGQPVQPTLPWARRGALGRRDPARSTAPPEPCYSRRVPRSRLNLEEFLPYRLSLASNVVSQVIAQSYEKLFALKMPEWRVITVLAERKELTQQEIVGLTQMDKVTVSRAAQVLERRALLRRVPNVEDARSLRLSLTPTGRDLYRRVVPAALALEAEVLEGLGPREVRALNGLLRRLEASATKILSRG